MQLLVQPTTSGGPTPTGTAGLYWRRAGHLDEQVDLDKTLSGQGGATFIISVPESGPATYVAKYHSTSPAYIDTESNYVTVTIVATKATTATLTGPTTAVAGGPAMSFEVTVTDGDTAVGGTGLVGGTVTLFANGVAVPGNIDNPYGGAATTFTVPVPSPGTTAYVAHFTPTFPETFSSCDSNTVTTTVVSAPLS
jgi:hypothetical protein